MARIGLRFISGKYKGGEYALPENKRIYVGRSSEIELVLLEDMVSRKHAQLWIEGDKIRIKDLGSTNGTFVNGEKITETVARLGDRILVGTSIMKVIETDKIGRDTQSESVSMPSPTDSVSRSTIHSNRSMAGTINEVPLPDLIQLFTTSKKTGTLVINRDGVEAKIHLDKGRIIYASIGDSPNLKPLKTIYRILSWEEGTFELLGPEIREFPETIDMPTEHILMEGLRQLDEIRHMGKKLPSRDAEIVVVTPLMSRLSKLKTEELDVFQLVYNYGTVKDVLNRSASSDLDTSTIIATLIKKEYIAQI
jgi:Domain of unknown function (DUF4388)/Inner membrane component of T3SS, cytoplasmic domain